MTRCTTCHRRIAEGGSCPSHGEASADGRGPDSAASAIAPEIDGFSVGAPIGRGGFAVVWRATRARDGVEVAIKVGSSSSPTTVERFRREAAALERIGPPHVPRLHAAGQLEDGRPYLAMELLTGRTLADELASRTEPPDASWIIARAGAILAALEAAHARGVVHRDLKPENIFLAAPGDRVVLLDFGLTRRAEQGGAPAQPALTRAGAVVGTLEYMAPEQLRGDPGVGPAADLYAFGVILFELATLRPPFVGDPSAIEHGHLALRPPRPGELAQVPPAIEDLALACLAKDPARRPVSAAAVRRALEEPGAGPASASSGARSGPESARRPPVAPRLVAEGRHPVVILVADTAAAAAPVIAAITGRKGHVVRQRGARYVGVFSGLDTDDPARAALTAARELADRHGARAALHLAGVTVRQKDRGPPAVYGAAVERPETWLPPEPWSGVVPSADFEAALPSGDEVTPAPSSAVASVGSVEIEVPLLGRDEALGALTEAAAAAFDGTCPGLTTILGDPGLGKSRLAAEAAVIARLAREDALVIPLRAAQPLPGEPAREVEALLAALLGADAPLPTSPHALMRAIAEALRGRAREVPVAVILDDAHWADDALVDALEYATLDGAGIRLWAVVAANPRFEQVRRMWGARTQRHARIALSPLDEPAAMQLAAELLKPAEYPPAETLRRLSGWAGGNPACLVEVVRALKRAGVVRRRPNAGTHYVATTELDALPPSPAWQWLATRQLGALPAELAACARLCAVLGVTFTRAELEHVQDALDREGGAGSPVDAGFGIGALVDRGILRRGAGDRCSFLNGVLQDAVYELVDPAQRAAIHGHALGYWRGWLGGEGQGGRGGGEGGERGGGEEEALEALARHAAACGEREEAADAYLKLGDLAFGRHRHVEADQRYTAALGMMEEGDARRRARALAGRGKSRYRIYRVREAREDLALARELATCGGDARVQIELLLEEATALDWEREFSGSAQRVEQARALARGFELKDLDVRLLVAQGRTLWRQGHAQESVDVLLRAVKEAEELGDYESKVIALLVMAFELVGLGRLDESEARFADVLDLSTRAHDTVHIGAAYANRVVLWLARKLMGRALEDSRHAISVAREVGNHWLERAATFNVALFLHWEGRCAEALPMARRASMLEERFAERPDSDCCLLAARILLRLGEYVEARETLSWVSSTCMPDLVGGKGPDRYIDYHVIRLALKELHPEATDSALTVTWEDLVALAEGSELWPEEMLELLYWRARIALLLHQWQEAAIALGKAAQMDCPMWRSDFEQLGVQLTRCRPQPAPADGASLHPVGVEHRSIS